MGGQHTYEPAGPKRGKINVEGMGPFGNMLYFTVSGSTPEEITAETRKVASLHGIEEPLIFQKHTSRSEWTKVYK